MHFPAPEGDRVCQNLSASDWPIRLPGTVDDINFAKNPSNFSEFNPQFVDDNFTKEPLNFVNVNFTKYPLNFNVINTHSIDKKFMKNSTNFGKIKKTP